MSRIDGQLINAMPEVVANLPSAPQPLNRIVQWGGDIYTWTGSGWTKFLNPNNIGSLLSYLTPCSISYLTGSGTHRSSYWFSVLSANATVGATYTNNGVTFVVVRSISGGTQLLLRATTVGSSTSNGVLTRATGTGDVSINFSSFKAPVYSILEFCGTGGTGGSGNQAAAAGVSGNTTFGTCTAFPGSPGAGSAAVGAGAPGGGYIVGAGFERINALVGGSGSLGQVSGASYNLGGIGGSNPFGANGSNGANINPLPPPANTGAGGGGGGYNNTIGPAGSGGGAGGYVKAINYNPTAPQAYSIGAQGTIIAAAVGGYNGAQGALGVINSTDYFQ